MSPSMISQRTAHRSNSVDLSQNQVQAGWRSQSIQARFEKAQLAYASGSGIRPLPPRDALSLLVDCRYEEVVRGLGFILNGAELRAAVQKLNPSAARTFNDSLTELAGANGNAELSPAQLCVARMVHALRVLGLDSATHAGDRAISLVEPYAHLLEHGLSAELQRSAGALSHRVVGAASLIAAQAHRDPAAQPCGVQIVRAARERGLPCIMVSSHHALGGDAVPLVAEHCAREGLLNGEISSQRLGLTAQDAHIFWFFKQDPLNWQECFHQLGTMAERNAGHVLVVQDTLSSISDDLLPFPIEALIREAHAKCNALSSKPLIIVPDKEQAMEALDSMPIAAVATDLFVPTKLGSLDKSCGEATVREVLAPFLDESQIENLLRDAQSVEDEVATVMSQEIAALLLME